jgi:hypothetical protein
MKIEAKLVKAADEQEVKDRIAELLSKNPNPSDDNVHELAEQLGVSPHDLEEVVYKMLSEQLTHRDKIPGGRADDNVPEDFDPEQVKMGIKIELEHTDDPKLAREIALDHLSEIPDYYTRLIEMEKEAESATAAKAPLGPLGGTVQAFMEVLKSRLIQYDQFLEKRGDINMYRIGHWLKAANEIDKKAKKLYKLDDETSIMQFKKIIAQHLFDDMPPVKAVHKQMKKWIEHGIYPSLTGRSKVKKTDKDES